MAAWEPQVGDRVRILKETAIIRYIGPVINQQGTWIGVEWDDPSRGKHNGSTGGVKYFTCTSPGNAGSFVRMEKVSFGKSVTDALVARYTNQLAEFGEEVAKDELYVHTSRHRRVEVKLIGQDKISAQQSVTQRMVAARVVGMDVSHVGSAAQLAEAAPHLMELDVSCNLISTWQFAVDLSAALPALDILNLSTNRIALNRPVAPPSLPGLRALILNSCGVTWPEVVALQSSLPNLEELHLCNNAISSLTVSSQGSPGPINQQQANNEVPADASQLEGGVGQPAPCAWQAAGFRALHVLSLEDNALGSWGDVLRLGQLPCLIKLHLSGNPLPDLTLPFPTTPATNPQPQQQQEQQVPADSASSTDAAVPSTLSPSSLGPHDSSTSNSRGATSNGPTAETASSVAIAAEGVLFPALQSLYLAGCSLEAWASVDSLNALTALRELRLTGNPVLAKSKTGGRFEVIGRVAGLVSLNGAAIGPRERRDCELRYLQHIAAEMGAAAAKGGQEAVVAVRGSHPRLRYLMESYGAVLATAAASSSSTGSLASSLVELRLTCVSAAPHAKMGTQTKRLPRSTTLGALRSLCEKLFKVKLEAMTLYVKAPGDPLPEDMGTDEDTTLSYFAVQDGYEVLVDEADVQAAKQAAAAGAAEAAAAHEERLAAQMRTAARLQEEAGRAMGAAAARKE